MICLFVRLSLVYISTTSFYIYLSNIALIIGTIFLLLYFTDLRDYGFESSSNDGFIWWKKYRLYHGILYISYGLMAKTKYYKEATLFLFIDFILGFVLFNINNS